MCQNGRSCYGGMCDCAPLYNGTSCENGASQNSVILNKCMSFCGVFVWTCIAPFLLSLPLPSPPSPSPLSPSSLPFPSWPSALGVPCGDRFCFNGGSCGAGGCECLDSYTGDYCQYRGCKLGQSISDPWVYEDGTTHSVHTSFPQVTPLA